MPKTITAPRRNFGEGGSDSSDLSDLSDSRQELFIVQHCYSEWINGMKEAAEMSENNASSIRKAAQANEELRQKGDSYLAQLELAWTC